MKFISIIIPAHNPNEDYLTDLLKTIYLQQIDDFEILIIDDFSTNDVIKKILMSSYRDDQRIRVIRHTQNKGVSAAINTGIQAANSKYIIHSGDDDLYLPSMMLYVQPILEQFLTYPNLAGGYVGLINIPEHFYLNDLLQNYNNLVPNHHYHSKINFLTFRNGPGFATHQVFLKTEIAKKTLYKENIRYGADHEFWLRLLRNGYEFRYLGRYGAVYRQRKSSISHSKLATGLKARLNIDEDLLKDIRNEDIIKSAPFVYKKPAEYYQQLLLKIQKICNWAGYAKAMNNTQEYLEIISFMPVEITDMLELHEIRPAILSGFIRYFSTQYSEKEASIRTSENIIQRQIEEVIADLYKKNKS